MTKSKSTLLQKVLDGHQITISIDQKIDFPGNNGHIWQWEKSKTLQRVLLNEQGPYSQNFSSQIRKIFLTLGHNILRLNKTKSVFKQIYH